jgi:N-formylmaleamate deformylase
MLLGIALLAAGLSAPVSSSTISVEVTGAGRPMILIPGFVSSGAVWKGTVDHYKDRYECHVITVAGFAGVPPATPAGLQRLRDDIIAYAVAKKLDHPVIVGHSMGGMLAIWIAETRPELPAAVISVDGVPFLSALMNPAATAESSKAQAAQMQQLYASMTPQQLGMQSRMAFQAMISDPARVDEATKWAEASDPLTAATLIYDLMTTDIRADVKQIAAPLLLIPALKGMSGDAEMLKRAQASYEAQIAAVPVHEIVPAQTLHFVMLDDPAFLQATMDAFLARRTGKVR